MRRVEKLCFKASGWATPAAVPAENGCHIASVLILARWASVHDSVILAMVRAGLTR
jgi:hypothetical protein